MSLSARSWGTLAQRERARKKAQLTRSRAERKAKLSLSRAARKAALKAKLSLSRASHKAKLSLSRAALKAKLSLSRAARKAALKAKLTLFRASKSKKSTSKSILSKQPRARKERKHIHVNSDEIHKYEPDYIGPLLRDVDGGLAPYTVNTFPPELQKLINGKKPLKTHQVQCINFLMRSRGLIAAHGVGTGKTKLAAAFALSMVALMPNVHCYFLTPASLQNNIIDELESLAPGSTTASHVLKSLSSAPQLRSHMHFFTFDKFYRQAASEKLPPHQQQVLIIDEAHNLRNSAGKKYQVVESFARRALKVLLLTATPVVNSPSDLYPLIGMVDGSKSLNNRVSFFQDLTATQRRHLVQNKISVFHPTTASQLSHFPGSTEHKVDLIMDSKYYEKYRKVEQHQWEEWRSKMGDHGNLEVFLNGLRQAINGLDGGEGAKIKWVVNKVSTLKSHDKVIIFSNWIGNGIKLVQKELKRLNIRFTKVTGTRTKEQRQKSVRLFNSGKRKVLFLTRAGGEGLDIKGATQVVLMEPSWHDAAEHQVIGRAIRYESHAHLPAQHRHVDIWRLIMRKPTNRLPGDTKWDSVDIRVRELLLKKKVVNDKAMAEVKRYRVKGGRL